MLDTHSLEFGPKLKPNHPKDDEREKNNEIQPRPFHVLSLFDGLSKTLKPIFLNDFNTLDAGTAKEYLTSLIKFNTTSR